MIENSQLIALVEKIALNFKPQKIFLSEPCVSGDSNSESNLNLLIIQVSKLPNFKRVQEMRKLLVMSKIQMSLIVLTPELIEDEQELKSSTINKALKTAKLLYERI